MVFLRRASSAAPPIAGSTLIRVLPSCCRPCARCGGRRHAVLHEQIVGECAGRTKQIQRSWLRALGNLISEAEVYPPTLPIFSDQLRDAQILEALVSSVCALTRCRIP